MKNAFFGKYGGRFAPETLIPALEETEIAFNKFSKDRKFMQEYHNILKNFVGRETPLYFAQRLSDKYNAKIYLKREDLCHTGAHKINNAVGQALLALKLGKKHLIAETGAGQHGVATATVAAHFGLKCTIFMGSEDVKRQEINVHRMNLLGAEVIPVEYGSKTLKDAINEALRYWTKYVDTTHYLFGSVLGPHPFPRIVGFFQSVIGKEAKKQILGFEKKYPDYVIACVGGGSNAIGIFSGFLDIPSVKLYGIEAAGTSYNLGSHASRFINPQKGVLHGSYSYLIQKDGQIMPTHSIAPGMDYPMVGPEHAYLYDTKRVTYDNINDKEAIFGFTMLSSLEGIIPALESSHAVGYLEKIKRKIANKIVIVNISGRGDKDLHIVKEYLSKTHK